MVDEHGPVKGKAVADFELQVDNGHYASLAGLMGEKGLLLVFVHGTWCPVCVQVLFRLGRYTRTYRNHGADVAVVSSDPVERLDVFKRSAYPTFEFPMLSDKDGKTRQLYNLEGVNAFLLIDAGKILRHKFIDHDHTSVPGHHELLAAIDELPGNQSLCSR